METIKPDIDMSEDGVIQFAKDICTTTNNKEQYYENLKYDYEKVQVEVKLKMDELKKIRESNLQLKDYLNSHKFMMEELQKAEKGDIEEISSNEDSINNLRSEIDKLQICKNEDLKSYEDKVCNITEMFTEAPFSYSQGMLSEKIKKLLDIQADVKTELLNISSDLETIRKKFNLEEAYFVNSSVNNLDDLRLSAQEESNQLSLETEKLENEVMSLTKLSQSLGHEVTFLKKQHKLDDLHM